MLRVYARHHLSCESWEHAERKARLIEYESDPWRAPGGPPTARIPIDQAVKDFLADEQARKLAKTTTAQSVTLLQEQLLEWSAKQSLRFLDELITPKLRQFRASWENSASRTIG